ncbi:cellulose binding domain-containing protein [Sorangium sp. So ce362]|uniref:cellulose binding domain-containing protein n=1 Tax=Sorangium sp. So ce362 TaxID=3133303 RepID=UPI003F62FC37
MGSAGSTTSSTTSSATSSTTGVGGEGGAGGLGGAGGIGGAGGDGGADVTSTTMSSSVSSTASSSVSSTTSSSVSSTASSSVSSTASSTTGVGGGSATSSTTASSTTGGITTPALELQYAARATAAESSELSFQVRVKNTGDESIALSDLTIRYWFTADVTEVDLKSDCDFALTTSICANVVTSTFDKASGTDADHYLELGFLAAAGSISPGATTGPVQVRIHNRDVYDRMTQTDDYSFEATTAWIPSMQITVYHERMLAWGIEP